jgi:hypothetical protein
MGAAQNCHAKAILLITGKEAEHENALVVTPYEF